MRVLVSVLLVCCVVAATALPRAARSRQSLLETRARAGCGNKPWVPLGPVGDKIDKVWAEFAAVNPFVFEEESVDANAYSALAGKLAGAVVRLKALSRALEPSAIPMSRAEMDTCAPKEHAEALKNDGVGVVIAGLACKNAAGKLSEKRTVAVKVFSAKSLRPPTPAGNPVLGKCPAGPMCAYSPASIGYSGNNPTLYRDLAKGADNKCGGVSPAQADFEALTYATTMFGRVKENKCPAGSEPVGSAIVYLDRPLHQCTTWEMLQGPMAKAMPFKNYIKDSARPQPLYTGYVKLVFGPFTMSRLSKHGGPLSPTECAVPQGKFPPDLFGSLEKNANVQCTYP